jgi:enterochelin esterase-like enzyme
MFVQGCTPAQQTGGAGGRQPGGAGISGAGTGGTANGSGGSASGGDVGTGGVPGRGGSTDTGGSSATGGGHGGTAVGSGGASSGPIVTGAGGRGLGGLGLPDPGSEGDGDSQVGPTYTTQPDLTDRGAPKGKEFQFTLTSKIFDGNDPTVTRKPVVLDRTVSVYIPAQFKDSMPAPVAVIGDGPGRNFSSGWSSPEYDLTKRALDNLTIATDMKRRIPPFIVVSVENGGSDSIGSERGLEYDTVSDRYARFIDTEVLPAVQNNASIKAAFPNLKITTNPSGRAAMGCSSGSAAAFTMGWFRPDLFGRIIIYSPTLVAQQNPRAPEAMTYPLGAWEYHSSMELIKNDTMMREKFLRIFLAVDENDNGSTAPESGHHNWVMANQRTAAALKAKGYHYKFVLGLGQGHCAAKVKAATLADALIWAWRGYQPTEN